jgi:ribonuclease R
MKKRILQYLSGHPGTPFAIKELARLLRIRTRSDMATLMRELERLSAEGILRINDSDQFFYVPKKHAGKEAPPPGRRTGVLTVTRRGAGAVLLHDTGEQISIGPKSMGTALHGDTVAVVAYARKRTADAPEGEVVAVIKRARTRIVGRLERSGHFNIMVPDDPRITRDIYVAREKMRGAKSGDKVVVDLLPWVNEHLNPEGEVAEVLGPSGEPHAEVRSVARGFGLPMSFPAGVEKEAAAFAHTLTAEDLRGRLDLRGTLCVTIDPVDAKDFDDALSFEPLDGGSVRLGVHIADVSHYVREGTALDQEALQRGTSVYMVNEVVPMLPERLSNDLCSLKPEVDRLTYSVMMTVNRHGTVEEYQIRKSVIHSARRFSYEEVQSIIDKGRGEHADLLIPLQKFTEVLYRKRRKNGSLDFDSAEAKFEFDRQGLPVRIVRKERLEAHRLVEECMLLANMVVARHIGAPRRPSHILPFVYRVHDLPNPDRLRDLAGFVKRFGFSLDASNGVSSRELQKLLDRARGSEVEYIINEVALRSMAKAVYSEKNIGHYGLAFTFYTHFTSPIRRYPDLIVHRLLHEYEQDVSHDRRKEIGQRLPFLCIHSSERERNAMEAERASVKVMQVEYMKRHVGDELEGVIGGVTEFGVFVEINDLLIEGLVRVRDMEDDFYIFDQKHYALRGRSRGKVYRLGDKIRVQVMAVDPHEQQIDFRIVK